MIARGYLKDVKAKEVSWLWKPYIAFGKVTLIQGDTGIGMTSLLMKVIADLSNGIYPPTTISCRGLSLVGVCPRLFCDCS